MIEPEKKSGSPAERLPVFVYGTLRPGQKNHPLFLEGRTTAELPATVSGRLYFVEEGGYPYLLPGEGEVVGTLVHIAGDRYDETLKRLDRLEDYDSGNEAGSLYLRRRTHAVLADGTTMRAWAYYWNAPEIKGRRIESGDFLRR